MSFIVVILENSRHHERGYTIGAQKYCGRITLVKHFFKKDFFIRFIRDVIFLHALFPAIYLSSIRLHGHATHDEILHRITMRGFVS